MSNTIEEESSNFNINKPENNSKSVIHSLYQQKIFY